MRCSEAPWTSGEAAILPRLADSHLGHPGLVLSPWAGGWEAQAQSQRWGWEGRWKWAPEWPLSCCLPLGLRTKARRPQPLEIIGPKRNFPNLAGLVPAAQDSE